MSSQPTVSVVMSVYNGAETLGASEYFIKPVKLDKLISTAEKLIGS